MKVLVYGAGVIGCYLAHVLCSAGNDVTLLARGAWKDTLERDGLVIRHSLQRKTTIDHPRIISTVDEAAYDAVFAVMQHGQMWAALDDLAAVDSPLVTLVGNNLSAPEMEAKIREKSPGKTILFGFQATGGNREKGKVECARFGSGKMTLGRLYSEASPAEKETIKALFAGTKYQLVWMPDMDGWLKTHMAFILPTVYLCYTVNCDLRKATKTQRKAILEATIEGEQLLKLLGIPILPAGEEESYTGVRRKVVEAMLFIMAKTKIGELAATDHCRHAVAEMEGLEQAWNELRAQKPDCPMPHWDALRSAMPDWSLLHQQYIDRSVFGLLLKGERECE